MRRRRAARGVWRAACGVRGAVAGAAPVVIDEMISPKRSWVMRACLARLFRPLSVLARYGLHLPQWGGYVLLFRPCPFFACSGGSPSRKNGQNAQSQWRRGASTTTPWSMAMDFLNRFVGDVWTSLVVNRFMPPPPPPRARTGSWVLCLCGTDCVEPQTIGSEPQRRCAMLWAGAVQDPSPSGLDKSGQV